MPLITGPPGSGKTAHVLQQFRAALAAKKQDVRLLVPTATMAHHLENQVAREGFVLRRGLIQTLNGFVDLQVPDFPKAPESVVYLLVEEAVARLNRAEFRRVADLPGFCARLARAILEFSAAGCDSDRLAGRIPDSPLAGAFLAIYQEVDRALDRRGLLLRAKRLECAAARIRANGLPDIAAIWLDGFHALPDPELAIVHALVCHVDLTLTLPDYEATAPLRKHLVEAGFTEERFAKKRPAPAMVLVKAARIERECEEIARRILKHASAGRPFREIGIIVRSHEPHVPLLRATLQRFSIPAHFYFDENAVEHPAIRFLTRAIDAMLGGWDHAATLAVLRLAPRFADSPALDRLDFAVREQIPNTGLGSLKALLPDPEAPLAHLIDALGALEEWRSFTLSPPDWAARLTTLRNLYRFPHHANTVDPDSALVWRSHRAALDLFEEALAEAALAMESARPMSLPEFWRAVKSVLRLKPLRVSDARRNVVHVMSAYEARQWVLPIVFVCGMIEKQFPQIPTGDLFFPDAARHSLQAAGIRVRTARDIDAEERALFDSAVSRATMLVTLTLPEFSSRGERNLPSLFLDSVLARSEMPRIVRPTPRSIPTPPPPPAIRSSGLLATLRERTTRLTASGLESWLQCPFQYFAGRMLSLRTSPPRPEDRLDFRLQGEIVHTVLAEWYADRQPIGPLFERAFEACLERYCVPQGYHTERLRNGMLADLERFAADTQWQRSRFSAATEQKFEFPLQDSFQLAGRIDRIDTDSDGNAYVIDYKYSAAEQVKKKRNGNQLQGPLYLLAAQTALNVRPSGMFFVALKKKVEYVGWSGSGLLNSAPVPPEWAEIAARLGQIGAEIRQGRIAPSPADTDNCRFCDFREICRIEISAPAALALPAET